MRYAPFPLAVYAGKQARHPAVRSPYMLMRCRTRGVETMYYIVSIGVTRYWQGDDVVHRLYNVGGSSLTARHSAVPTSLSCGMIGAGLDVCFLRQCFVGTHLGASVFVCRRVRIVTYSRVFTISLNAGVEPRRGDIIQHRVLTLCLYGIPAKRIGNPEAVR